MKRNRPNRWEQFNNQAKKEAAPTVTPLIKTFDENATYNLVTHAPENFLGSDIVFNPDVFPNIKILDKILVTDNNGNQILIQAGKDSFSNELKNKTYQISLSKSVADNYTLPADLSNKVEVKIKILEDYSDFQIDLVEISFKDQFFSRRDLYKFTKDLVDTCIYTSKQVQLDNLKMRIMYIMSNGRLIHSGVITAKTKFIFRTQSCKYNFLFEITKEFCSSNIKGQLYLEKSFSIIKALLQRMDALHTHHKFVFLFFARLYYPQFKTLKEAENQGEKLQQNYPKFFVKFPMAFAFQIDDQGRVYQDVYHRVNTKESKRDWLFNIKKIKSSLFDFLNYINWKINAHSNLSNFLNNLTYINFTTNKVCAPSLSRTISTGIPKLQQLQSMCDLDEIETPLLTPIRIQSSNDFYDNLHFNFNTSNKYDYNGDRKSSANDSENSEQDMDTWKIPIECELSSSENCNFLQAVALSVEAVREGFRQSRSLSVTGSCVLVFSAGDGKYHVDDNFARFLKDSMITRVKLTLLCLKDEVELDNAQFILSRNGTTYGSLNEENSQNLFSDNSVKDRTSSGLSSGISFEFSNFSVQEKMMRSEECFFQNDIDLMSKKINLPSQSTSEKIKVLKIPPRTKSIYWIPIIKGFTPEVISSLSQIFTFSKTNPDPFLSLQYQDKKLYQPIDTIKTLLEQYSQSNKKNINPNPLINPLLRGEFPSQNKDLIAYSMNSYDTELFKMPEAAFIEDQSLIFPPIIEETERSIDSKSFRSESIFGDAKTFDDNQRGSIRATVTSQGQAGNYPLMQGRMIFKSIVEISRNSTENNEEPKRKIYSHLKLRWSRLDIMDMFNSLIRSEMHKLTKKITDPYVLEFEDIWKNLCQPPNLPLSNYYFPTESELIDPTKYEKLQYYIYLVGDIKKDIDEFVQELLGHRLSLDYQYIEEDSLNSYGKGSCAGLQYNKYPRLSFGNTHHRFHLKSNESLICYIFTKKKSRMLNGQSYNVKFFPIYYRYLLFNDRIKGLMKKDIMFDTQKLPNFNKFDMYVTDKMKETLKNYTDFEELLSYNIKQISLVLIPASKSDAKPENRVAKFEKFLLGLKEKLLTYGYKTPLSINIHKKRKDYKYNDRGLRVIKIFSGGESTFSHFYMQFDSVFCPKLCYHFALNWFSCSSYVVNEFIRTLSGIAKGSDYLLKLVPTKYKLVKCHPFESNIRLNFPKEHKRFIIKHIQKSPFNFYFDSFGDPLNFIHEKGGLIVHIFDDFLVWKENRLADLNIQLNTESEDLSQIYEQRFTQLKAMIFALMEIDSMIDIAIGVGKGKLDSRKSSEEPDSPLKKSPIKLDVPSRREHRSNTKKLEEIII